MTRPCQACDGTYPGDDADDATFATWELNRAALGSRCLACDGSGRIEDRIPASDATADAETFLLARPRVTDELESIHCFTWRGDDTAHARMAARAAFRAVPGLRGYMKTSEQKSHIPAPGYTDLTPDQRSAWDAMVSDCQACTARDDDEPCSDHDLSEMSISTLSAMIATWLQS